MKILVTGGAGFIGSNFIFYWLKKYPNDEIINLDIMSYSANPQTIERQKKEFGKRYEFIQGDINDTHLVDRIISEVDLIVHFAAETHVDRSVETPIKFVEINTKGTQVLLESAHKHGKKRFHHISTDEVYGTLDLDSKSKFTEKTQFNPRSPYSASKAAADHLVNAYYHTFNLPITITNCSNNYGPYLFPEKIIPLFITRLMNNLPVPIYGEGKAVRDYLFVEDHCNAIERVIQGGTIGESYCVGGNNELNTVQVADILLKKLDKPKELLKFTKDRPGHDPRYAIDFTKIKSELGWTPSVTFEEGIDKTISWYKENESWWKPMFTKANEIAEKYLQNI